MAVSVGNTSIVSNGLICHLNPSISFSDTLTEVEVLVVAGGGGGGGRHAGGGGGGGVLYSSSYKVTIGTPVVVTVGNGGNAGGYGGRGGNGQNSVFGNLTAIGGGGGGGYDNGNPTVNGATGGSGGGGAAATGLPGGNGTGASGTSGQGNAGATPIVFNDWAGGGGGGAGGNGTPPSGFNGGRGGIGFLSSISGTPRYYGGGGGAGGGNNIDDNGGLGGLGGGGRGTGAYNPTQGTPGQTNTGGGGGGSRDQAGTTGGSGVVIVRYLGPQKATGGNTITSINGYTIHTFTSSGTFTPTSGETSVNGLEDLSGYGNNAKATGSIGIANVANVGRVIDYNTSSIINVDLRNPVKNDRWSMIFWARSTGLTTSDYRGVIRLRDLKGSPGYYYNVDTRQTINSYLLGYQKDDTINDWLVYGFNNQTQWANQTWWCCGVSMNGTEFRHYTNGTLGSTQTQTRSIDQYTNIFSIQLNSNGSNTVYLGEFYFYDRVISDSDFSTMFDLTKGRFGF